MQDAANEIVLAAAVHISEQAAGSRITQRVAPPTRNTDTTKVDEPNTASATESGVVAPISTSLLLPEPHESDHIMVVTKQKELIKLERTVAKYETQRLGPAFTQVFAVIPGSKSTVIFQSGDISHFAVKWNAASSQSGYQVYPCKVVGDSRKCRMMALKIGQDDITLNNMTTGAINRFIPTKAFEPGDYCFGRRSDFRLRGDVVTGQGQAYCFSVSQAN